MTNEITIPTAATEELTKRINRLNRKAIKIGAEQVSFTLGTPYTQTQNVTTGFGQYEDTEERIVPVVDVTFDNTDYLVDGYRMVGVSDTEDNLKILHTLDDSFDLSEHRGTCACDHCNSNRPRNKVYLMANEDNNIVRLGSTCVRDFFKSTTDNALANLQFQDELFNILSDFEGSKERFTNAPSVYKPLSVLEIACEVASEVGYVSNRKAEGLQVPSTGSSVKSVIGDVKNPVTPSAESKKKAQSILDWFETTEEDSSYFENVREILETGFVPFKYIGYIVGLIGAHNYFTAKQGAKKNITSVHLGTVGERMEFTGKIVSVTPYYSEMWGAGNITKIDCYGNIVTYFNSIKLRGGDCAEEGDMVNFWAAVKKHDEFNDVPQTTISRATKVKILSGVVA